MFISPFSLLPNPAYLCIELGCRRSVGYNFSLTNEDVAQLSTVLPRLEILDFGVPCFNNTCRTTISCLLALSVHYKGLLESSIHFNTINLVNDVQTLSEDSDFRDLHSPPTRYSLNYIFAGDLLFPAGTSDEDITTIAMGLINIFPPLSCVLAHDKWDRKPLNSRIRELQAVRLPPLDQT